MHDLSRVIYPKMPGTALEVVLLQPSGTSGGFGYVSLTG